MHGPHVFCGFERYRVAEVAIVCSYIFPLVVNDMHIAQKREGKMWVFANYNERPTTPAAQPRHERGDLMLGRRRHELPGFGQFELMCNIDITMSQKKRLKLNILAMTDTIAHIEWNTVRFRESFACSSAQIRVSKRTSTLR